MPTSFDTYISKIEADYRKGIATEHTYRSTLENLMESLGRGIQASNDPKHIECGAPDFVVEKGKVPLGYVETKDVGVGLDKIEKTDQMRRYLKALNNLILTDYLEFRWYVNGERKRVVRAAEVGKGNRLLVSEQSETNIVQLFQDFYATEAPTVTSARELAGRLAGVTHFIRDQIIAAFLQQASEVSETSEVSRGLVSRYRAFRELLLPALKPEEFADLYAQVMTHGLFAAKLSAPALSGLRPPPQIRRNPVGFGGGRVGVARPRRCVLSGKELVELHLFKAPKVDETITFYSMAGDNVVEKVAFAPEPTDPKDLQRSLGSHGQVWINPQQYFGNVPEAVWNFKVGGYQVCEKWLKDRKGRVLSGNDITHYQRVVVALKETIRLMEEIEEIIPGWPMA